jgi:hypothetical protein
LEVEERGRAEKYLAQLRGAGRSVGTRPVVNLVEQGGAAEVILRLADEQDAHVIVMATPWPRRITAPAARQRRKRSARANACAAAALPRGPSHNRDPAGVRSSEFREASSAVEIVNSSYAFHVIPGPARPSQPLIQPQLPDRAAGSRLPRTAFLLMATQPE